MQSSNLKKDERGRVCSGAKLKVTVTRNTDTGDPKCPVPVWMVYSNRTRQMIMKTPFRYIDGSSRQTGQSKAGYPQLYIWVP